MSRSSCLCPLPPHQRPLMQWEGKLYSKRAPPRRKGAGFIISFATRAVSWRPYWPPYWAMMEAEMKQQQKPNALDSRRTKMSIVGYAWSWFCVCVKNRFVNRILSDCLRGKDRVEKPLPAVPCRDWWLLYFYTCRKIISPANCNTIYGINLQPMHAVTPAWWWRVCLEWIYLTQ